MRVSSDSPWGVIEGATLGERQALRIELETETKTVGATMRFKPTRHALDVLAKQYTATFDEECRTVWGHFYKSRTSLTEDFKFKTEPYDHQRAQWLLTRDLPSYGYFWEMGTGKTKVMLDVAAWLYSTGQIDGVCIVTLKGVHANWIVKEIPEHLAVEKYKAAYWVSHRVEGNMKGILKYPGLAIASLNFDVISNEKGRGYKFLQQFLRERRTLLLVDESHGIKTPSASRTRALLRVRKSAKFKRIATGTSSPNGPLDLFAQFKFLSDRIFDHCDSMSAFKTQYAIEQDIPGTENKFDLDPITKRPLPIKTVVGYKNIDDLKKRIAPHCSFISKEDCLDLPPKVYRRHPFELTEDMRKAYSDMRNKLRMELESGEVVSAQLALTKMLRLHQLACGFTQPDGSTTPQPFGKSNPRLAAFEDYSEKVRGQAIVWANYLYNIDELYSFLRKQYGSRSTVVYVGATSDTDRIRAVQQFQAGKVQWFLGNQQAGGTGITLTAAKDVAYYSNNHRLDLRLQSEDRAHRIGQTGTVTYTDFEALGTIDREIINALRSKKDIADTLSGKTLGEWLANGE